MRSKNLVGLLLVATLMAAMVPSLTAVYAEGQDKQREKAEAFIAIALDAQEEADKLMNTTEVPPEVDALYQEGVGNLTAAQEELNSTEPDYGSVISLAREAMSIFTEVYKQLDSDAKVQSEMEDQNKGLIEAMNRALERIDKINGTVPAGFVQDEINKILLAAQAYLDIDVAHNWLADRRVNETAWNLTQANKLIGLAHSMLMKGGQVLKVKRIRGYLEVLQNFYNRTKRLLDDIDSGPVAEDLRSQLVTVYNLIDDAKGANLTDPDGVQTAIDNLIEARNQLEQIWRELLELRRGKPPAPPGRPNLWVFETADTGNPEVEDAVDLISMYGAPIKVEVSYKKRSVEFKITLPTADFVNDTNGNVAFAFDVDANGTADWHVKHQPSEIGQYFPDAHWGYAYVEAGNWIKWSRVPPEIAVEEDGNVFTVTVPMDMLGGSGSAYRFAIDVWHEATPEERQTVDAQFYRFQFPDQDIAAYPAAPWFDGVSWVSSGLYYQTTVGES